MHRLDRGLLIGMLDAIERELEIAVDNDIREPMATEFTLTPDKGLQLVARYDPPKRTLTQIYS